MVSLLRAELQRVRERERRKRGARERGRGAVFTGSFPKARSQEHVFHNKANNSPCFNY